MLSRPGARLSRPARLALIAAGFATLPLGSTGASAQASGCGDLQTYLVQRKSIAEKLTSGGKKKLDATVACGGFGQLVANGNTLIKWAETNKDWCQIPDSFVQGVKADHAKAVSIRGQACGMVAKQQQMAKQMEKQAREGGGGGLLGGGGLTGQARIPQGAL